MSNKKKGISSLFCLGQAPTSPKVNIIQGGNIRKLEFEFEFRKCMSLRIIKFASPDSGLHFHFNEKVLGIPLHLQPVRNAIEWGKEMRGGKW